MPTTLDRIKELDNHINAAHNILQHGLCDWAKEITFPAHDIVKRGCMITGQPGLNGIPGQFPRHEVALGATELRTVKGELFVYVHWKEYCGEGNWLPNPDHPTLRFPARWLNDPDAAMEELRVWTAERAKRREEKARLKREEETERKQNEHREFIKREAERLGIL